MAEFLAVIGGDNTAALQTRRLRRTSHGGAGGASRAGTDARWRESISPASR